MADTYKIWTPKFDGDAPPNWKAGMKWAIDYNDGSGFSGFDEQLSELIVWNPAHTFRVPPEAMPIQAFDYPTWAAQGRANADKLPSGVAEALGPEETGTVLWLWQNGDGDYLAYDNPYPCESLHGDPLTIGYPFARARLLPSVNSRPNMPASCRTMGVRPIGNDITEPDTSGDFEGDVWFGHPEKRTLGTHIWRSGAWHLLPTELDAVISLLEKARTQRDAAIEGLFLAKSALERGTHQDFQDETYQELDALLKELCP